VPPQAGVIASIRNAARGLYLNSFRLVPANLAWGVTLILVLYLVRFSPLAALLWLLMIPLSAGLGRMTARLVRDDRATFADWRQGFTREPGRILGIGFVQLALMAVGVLDITVGSQLPPPLGPFLAVASFYLLLATWVVAFVVWPVVLDPLRADEPILSRVRLGIRTFFARPVAIGLLALLGLVLLFLGVLLPAALVTFVVALVWLVSATIVLPTADRLEGRATLEVDED